MLSLALSSIISDPAIKTSILLLGLTTIPSVLLSSIFVALSYKRLAFIEVAGPIYLLSAGLMVLLAHTSLTGNSLESSHR